MNSKGSAVQGLLLAAATFAFPLQIRAAEAANDDKAMREAAEQVYEGLLKNLRAAARVSVADVESVGEWSKRILAAEIAPPLELMTGAPVGVVPPILMVESVHQAMTDHARRMKALESLLTTKIEQGAATSVEAAAARFFRMEIDALLSKIGREAKRRAKSLVVPPVDFDESLESFAVFTVEVDAKNAVLLDGAGVSLDQLKVKLQEFAKANKKSALLLICHGDSKLTLVQQIFDLAHTSGIERIQYASRDDSEEP